MQNYRPEIDGLRTIAVLPVILFHAGISIFSGGYVGVDVFFVISGYLITSILLRELAEGRFSLVNFYERRARRILPALFVVMFACIPFAWVWMLPWQFAEFGRSLVAVVVFVSNIQFWRESGYFAATAEEKPLLHTWSLAVEEQYYILFPIGLWLLWRFGARAVAVGIVLASLISLGLSEWGWRNQPNANFYLLPTRAWELLAGSLLALWVSRRALPTGRWAEFGSAAGLAMIFYAILVFDKGTPFPSLWALLPVGGAVLVILCANADTLTGRFLSLRPMVGIGLISYSAYLWHQPLFAFARIRSITHPSQTLMLVLAVAAFVLAWMTWKWIETPFRKRAGMRSPSRRAIFLMSGGAGAVLLTLGLVLDNQSYFKSTLPKAGLELLKNSSASNTHFRKQCFLSSGNRDLASFDRGYCLNMRTDKPNVLLIGNSHAAHFAQALFDSFPKVNLLQATSSGCAPVLPLRGSKRCVKLMEEVFDAFLRENRLDGIVLSAYWRHKDLPGLQKTIAMLRQYSDNIIVIGPAVTYEAALPSVLLNGLRFGADKTLEDYAAKFRSPEQFTLDHDMSNAISGIDGVTYFSVINSMCAPQCDVFDAAGAPMTFDKGHLTYPAAMEVLSHLKGLTFQ